MPFVPGRARGRVKHGIAKAGSEDVVVVPFNELRAFGVRPAGVVLVGGAPLSHPMIRLLSQRIPTVVVTPEQAEIFAEGSLLTIDGTNGVVSTSESVDAVASWSEPQASQCGRPYFTADGQAVELRASVGDAVAAASAVTCGATSLGLVRSEYLIPEGGRRPTKDFFCQTLAAICEAAQKLPVNIRLIDLAEDKRPPWMGALPGMAGPLGLQGVRLYGVEPVRSVVRAEIDAVGEIASLSDVSLILPYVTHPEEFIRWRGEIMERLDTPVNIGCILETPAAALAMAEWLEMADVIAIGCNDLMQCLFAADRDLIEVGHLLDPYAPTLYRFLRYVAQLAAGQVARVQLCGLLPQLPRTLPVLMGLGYRVFSVEPMQIPELARIVSETNIHDSQALASDVCAASNSTRVRQLLSLPAGSAWNVRFS